MISILDYGAGNVGSVIRMIDKAGGNSKRITSESEILQSTQLIIPGVGAFDHAMTQLKVRGLYRALDEVASVLKIPVLGICLGMQLMCKRSDEGLLSGFGWIDAEVKRFDSVDNIRIPHMGWNTVRVCRDNPLLSKNLADQRFYFAHSYRVQCYNANDSIAETDYGHPFVSAFQHANLYGVQFHPEKSHKFGLELMRHFINLPHA
jgi:glutamine amidotransferase